MNPLTTDRLDILPINSDPLRPGWYFKRGTLIPFDSPGIQPTPLSEGNVIGVGKGAGGSILSWVHDGDELINVAGWFGRAMQQTLFLQKKGVGVVANPTMAGDMYGDYKPGPRPDQIPPRTWNIHTFVCGARMLDMEVTGEGEQRHIRTFGIPFEWDPAGDWFNNPQRGSMFNRLEYRDIRFGFDIDTNWKHPGIHRVKSTCWLMESVPGDIALTWVPHEFYLRFGYDGVFYYSASSGPVDLTNTKIPNSEFKYADLTNQASYLAFRDRLEIGGSRNFDPDPKGTYKTPLFDSGSGAVMYRCNPTSAAPWSFKKDLCVAWYSTEVTARAEVDDDVRQKNVSLRWSNPRSQATPTNGVYDAPCMFISDRHAWDYHTPNPEPGLLESTAFLVIGTWDEVMDRLQFLNGETQ